MDNQPKMPSGNYTLPSMSDYEVTLSQTFQELPVGAQFKSLKLGTNWTKISPQEAANGFQRVFMFPDDPVKEL